MKRYGTRLARLETAAAEVQVRRIAAMVRASADPSEAARRVLVKVRAGIAELERRGAS